MIIHCIAPPSGLFSRQALGGFFIPLILEKGYTLFINVDILVENLRPRYIFLYRSMRIWMYISRGDGTAIWYR